MLLDKLSRRIIDISYKRGLSHLSSCLTSVRLIDNMYQVKKDNEPFILSNGHAALALYVVLEKYFGKDADELFERHGVHPNRDLDDGIYCSTGSLGMGVTVAVGMAIADKTRNVWLLMSDGELAEGSCWEALRIAGDLRLENLRIMVNANSNSAYGKTNVDMLDARMQMFYPSLVVQTDMFKYPHYLQSFDGHYKTLNKEEYEDLITLK